LGLFFAYVSWQNFSGVANALSQVVIAISFGFLPSTLCSSSQGAKGENRDRWKIEKKFEQM